MDLIITAPTVVYRTKLTNGEVLVVRNPSELPDASKREYIEEPYCWLEMITPKDYVGPLMELANSRRGEMINMQYLTEERTNLIFDMPLAEVVTDFFDELKSKSRGYASMEYALTDYRKNDLVKLDIRINQELAEPLATICHRDQAYHVGKALTVNLKELIPRQMFRIPIQVGILLLLLLLLLLLHE